MRNTDYFYNELMKKTGGDVEEAKQYVIPRTDREMALAGIDRKDILNRLGVSVDTAAPSSRNYGTAAKLGTFIGKAFDYLARPGYAVANVYKDIVDDKDGFKPWESFKRGWYGQDKTSFYEGFKAAREAEKARGYVQPEFLSWINPIGIIGHIFGKHGEANADFRDKVFGYGADIFLTPPAGFGLLGKTRLGQLAEIASKGQKAEAGSDLAKEIAKAAAKNPSALNLAATPSQQAALGQRALVSFAGKPIIKGAPVFRAGEWLTDKFKNTAANAAPLLQLPLNAFYKGWNNPEAREAADLKKRFERLENYRKYQAIQSGKELLERQKALNVPESELFNKIETLRKGVYNTLNAARHAPAKTYKVDTSPPVIALNDALMALKPTVQKLTTTPDTKPELIKFIYENLGGRKSSISKSYLSRQSKDDLKFIAERVKPSVRDAVALAAKQQGINIGKLFDAALHNTPKDIVKRAGESQNAHWARVVGLAAKKVDDLASLPKEEADFIREVWRRNEANLAAERSLGVPTPELQGGLNYMMHKLTPHLEKKFGNKALMALFGLSKPAGVLSPIQIQRKYRGTVEEINKAAREGRLHDNKTYGKFFEDNPALVQTHRDAVSQALQTRAQFLHEAAQRFGHDTASAPANYRAIDSKEFAGLLRDKVFDPEVADIIEKQIRIFSDPHELRKAEAIGVLFDAVQTVWKKITLLPIPAYHIRNIMGNFWMNFLGGVLPPPFGKSYGKALAVMSGKDGSIKTKAGQTISYDQIREQAFADGIPNRGWFTTEIDSQLLGNASLDNPGGFIDNLPLMKQGAWLQKNTENWARYAHYIQKLEEGYSFEQAAASVKKYLFDPENLTGFERVWMRRLIPFYSWSRHNIPLQFENLITQPGKFSGVSHAISDVERSKEEKHGRPDEVFMGDWLREGLPVYYGGDPVKKQGRYAMLKYWFPGSDIQQVSQPHEWFLEGLSPFVKAPVEVLTNKSFYFDDPINRYSLETETANFLGKEMPRRVVHALKNLRVLNELDRLNPGGVFGKREFAAPEKERWLNFLTGLKLYTYNPEWEAGMYSADMRKDLARLKYDYGKAVREENKEKQRKVLEAIDRVMNSPRTKAMTRSKSLYYGN
ncbi:MAG: hypothetical protein K6T66_08735 [Peptococcaceae bacterium]|nr:hypothetical protein [Peptococcaceae bacterium]